MGISIRMPQGSTSPRATASGRNVACRTIPDMHRVAVLAFDDVVAFDLATPPQVFGSLTPARYDTRVCAAGREVTAAQGFTIGPQTGLDWLERADTVIVPGIGGRRSEVAPEALEALRRASAGGAHIASICTGALVLAAAGLLDGRRVTTHWGYVEDLRRAAPTATVEPDVLWIDEGDLVTSAGVAAGIDLCLHLVRRDHGAAVANQAARRMVVAPQRAGGQAQFIDRPIPEATGGLQA